MTALQAGVRPDSDDVFRDSIADHARRATSASDFLIELDGLPTAALTPRDKTTHALLRRELTQLVRMVGTGAHLQPSIFPFGADMAALRLGSVSSIGTASDAQTYIARLRAVPRAIEGFIVTLRAGAEAGVRYPSVVVERAVKQAHALLGLPADVHPLLDPFRRSALPRGTLQGDEATARSILSNEISAAIRAYADVLASEIRPLASETVHAGPQSAPDPRYQLAIEFFASVDDSADAIHALGLTEVARLTKDIEAVAADAGFAGDVGGLRAHVASDDSRAAATGELLRVRIESLAKRIDARIPEWIGHLPRSTYGVRSIPLAMADSLPPAYAQPNPADRSAAGTLWVTSIPSRMPAYLQVATTLHEGWPGHLMHVALIQEQADLPDFQRFNAIRYSACLEGWALYCEWLGDSMGLYETPLDRFGRLDMEMWRACRLVVDTGLHAGGWTRERAVAYMRDHLALPLATIEAEVDRYMGWPGQALSYQLGNIAFRALRREAEAALAARFDVRAFHDCLLAAGPVTLPVLEENVRRWIAERRDVSEPSVATDGRP